MLRAKQWFAPVVIMLSSLIGLLGKTPGYAAELQTLSIYGSNTIGEQLTPALAQAFLEDKGYLYVSLESVPEQSLHTVTATNQLLEPQVRIDIHTRGSSTGFAALLDGSGSIAASSRPIRDTEVNRLAALGDMKSKEAEHILAIDGLAIIVHRDNPLDRLSSEQLSKIFSGEIADWSQLGGPAGAINLYARDDNSGTWETFRELVLTPNGMSLHALARRFESSEELSVSVSSDVHGIGFIGLPYVLQAKVVAVSAGDTRAMQPDPELIATEDYPLSRRLYLYSAEHVQNELAREFLAFSHSNAGQRLVEKYGFISQEVSAVPVEPAADMPVSYQQLAHTARRLSVNFRFNEMSAQLDNKAQRDLERVIEYFNVNQDMIERLVLVGFGDSKVSPERAMMLSKLRALAVRRQLQGMGLYAFDILSVGDAMPVASNQQGQGRLKNQRVELWVR